MNKLLFIGCNNNQIPYLKEINKYSFKIIGTDINIDAPGRELCDKFYQVGYDDLSGLSSIGTQENFNCDDKIS